jgi:hypothetical protein
MHNAKKIKNKKPIPTPPRGITLDRLIEAINKSDLLENGPVEEMHSAGMAAFMFIAGGACADFDTSTHFYPLQKLFTFYYMLATPYNIG